MHLGIIGGLVLGVLANLVLLRYGWKATAGPTTVVAVAAFVALAATDAPPIAVVAFVLAYSLVSRVARPLLTLRLALER